MVDKLVLRLTSLLCTDTAMDEKDKAGIQYGLRVILEEGIKIIFLILFFHSIHHQRYFYFSLLILLSTRVFAGGIHVKGTLNCLMLTVLMFLFTSVLAPRVPAIPTGTCLLMGTACFLIVLIKAPICSVQRPIKDKRKRMQYKLTAALSVAFWTAVLVLLESTPYTNCGFGTLLLQSMQLLPVKKPKE